MQLRLAARLAAVFLAGAAYIGASHWLMTQTQGSTWNVVGVLGPMLVVIAVGGWRSGHRVLGAAAALVIAALCVQAVLGITVPSHVLYLAQHAGINFFLGILFGATLRAGHTPLITKLALRVHFGRLSPEMVVYTRKLTRAWAIFFMAVVAISLVLFAFASFDTWALFANIVTPIATVVMFAGEHVMRYRWHPDFERASAADAIRAYMTNSQSETQPSAAKNPS
jgi:uncharacterized membrane protein